MPLLWSKPFTPEPMPENLQDDEEIFVCENTQEIFRDYGSYYERVILCNSLVWGCSLMGGEGLTLLNAKACERECNSQVEELTNPLIKGILYTRSCCSVRDKELLVDTVFEFVQKVFFVGEPILFEDSQGSKMRGRVSKVEKVGEYYATADGQTYLAHSPTRMIDSLTKMRVRLCLNLNSETQDCGDVFSHVQPVLLPPRRQHSLIKEARIRRIKNIQTNYLTHVRSLKDDLLCTTLKAFPQYSPLSPLLGEHLGGVMSLLYFFNMFDSFLKKYSDRIPELDCEYVVRALAGDTECLYNVICAPLRVLLSMSKVEARIDTPSYSRRITKNMHVLSDDKLGDVFDTLSRSVDRFGLNLKTLGVGRYNVSEIVRLYWLISAAECILDPQTCSPQEVEALYFVHTHTALLRRLEHEDIYYLPPGDKLLLISCLVENITVHPQFRAHMDENGHQIGTLQKELRTLTAEETRRMTKYKRTVKVVNGLYRVGRRSKWWDDSSEDDDPRSDAMKEKRRDYKLGKINRSKDKTIKKLSELRVCANIEYLGVDRMFRRYYLFPTGLYVEITPQTRWLGEDVCSRVVTQLSVDPGNETWQQFSSRFSLNFQDPSERSPSWDEEYKSVTSPVFDMRTCPIHDQLIVRGQQTWAVIGSEETLSSLIECLNQSGVREKHLYGQLVKNRDRICYTCPVSVIECADNGLCTQVVSRLSFISFHVLDCNMITSEAFGISFVEGINRVDSVGGVISALHTLYESILPHYMLPPFGCGKKKKRGRQSVKGVVKAGTGDTYFVDLWGTQLREVRNLSQIVIMLDIFERHIVWDTVWTIYCRSCHKLRSAGLVVTCGGCSCQHHTQCLPRHPSSAHIPWMCDDCKDGSNTL